jgi:hypothetical protein
MDLGKGGQRDLDLHHRGWRDQLVEGRADELPTANAGSTAGNVHLRKGPRAKTHPSFLTAVDGRDTNGQRVTRPKH